MSVQVSSGTRLYLLRRQKTMSKHRMTGYILYDFNSNIIYSIYLTSKIVHLKITVYTYYVACKNKGHYGSVKFIESMCNVYSVFNSNAPK